MKLALTVACAVFLGTTLTVAQTKTTVFSTPHDIASAGCSSCHVPHQTSLRGQTLLWNQNFSTQTFGTYADGNSPTMDSIPEEIGDVTYSPTNAPSGAVQASVLCMSCHDGVTSTLVTTPSKNVGASPEGLRNDHPINMVYPTTDPGIVAEASLPAAIVLYSNGADNTVQCGSCHNPHDNALTPFLRIANTNDTSGICAACHL